MAMGIIELSPPTFGYEATGVVRSVGPGAEKLKVGDRVALTGFNVFRSTVITTEKLCAKLPDELDFTSGASMPLVFATAIYSLINIGRLQKGQVRQKNAPPSPRRCAQITDALLCLKVGSNS